MQSLTLENIVGQVMLMKSTIPPHVTTWTQFVQYNFIRKLYSLHSEFPNLILSFDNYKEVPVYKTIEQLKRTSSKKAEFDFSSGDKVPTRPPSAEVWMSALQNRVFKTVVISIICKIICTDYKPPIRPVVLVLDFCNATKIQYGHYRDSREALTSMGSMGESDVKFMRYATYFGGSILVESIDSDCICIAMLFVQQHEFNVNVFIKRMVSKSIDENRESETSKKRKLGEKRQIEYEIINIRKLIVMMHGALNQAVGQNFAMSPQQKTNLLVLQFLFTGSDYSRKIPNIGAKFIWEHLHVTIPLLLLCVHEEEDEMKINIDLCIDTVFSELYRKKYSNYVKASSVTFEEVITDVKNGKLSDKTKSLLPNREFLKCNLFNILFVIKYWKLHNKSPETCLDGRHGFVENMGKIEFGTGGY